MLVVDTSKGELLDDQRLVAELATAQPYQQWVQDNSIHLSALVAGARGKSRISLYRADPKHAADPMAWAMDTSRRLRAFGYTKEHLQVLPPGAAH